MFIHLGYPAVATGSGPGGAVDDTTKGDVSGMDGAVVGAMSVLKAGVGSDSVVDGTAVTFERVPFIDCSVAAI